MTSKELSRKIIEYRAKHNMSQEAFAKLCNVTPQTLCNVENGVQKPSKLTLQKILNIVGE